MTPESTQAAAIIDEFPAAVRRELRDALGRIAAVYRQGHSPRRPEQLALPVGDGGRVIVFPVAFKRRPPKRASRAARADSTG